MYSKAWEEWFGLVHGLGGDVAEGDDGFLVLYFIGWNVGMGVSVSVLNSKLARLAFLYKLLGHRDCTKDFLVRQVVKGYRRGHQPVDGRHPVSFELLASLFRVLPEVCLSAYVALLFQTAFSLAFFGALHIGELVSSSRGGSDCLQSTDM